ncbi:hypothetical protein F2Q68_00002423 [Brassica cretica]|uniref:DUF1985 domain-containing protein n=1 Tax=Brassica cretica TaxID=69181 RepID=A0A8S9JIM9_BRACR|nr:hypothetical protein F2Q68_00002423 [Brassica cretica]
MRKLFCFQADSSSSALPPSFLSPRDNAWSWMQAKTFVSVFESKPQNTCSSGINLKPFCFVELLRRSETAAVVGDHNISSSDLNLLQEDSVDTSKKTFGKYSSVSSSEDSLKDFRKTFGNFSVKTPEEGIYFRGRAICSQKHCVYTDYSKLLPALREALNDDEYEELKESKLEIFIKFKEMNFDWASMLAYYMLGFQLDIKKKYELWCLVGPEPVKFSLIEFEHLTGLNCNYFQDIENLRCGEWSRDDRMQLGYLAIFTGFIEGRKYSTATRACLARLVMDLEVWVYFAMPELGVNSGRPLPNRPSPPLLAYRGGKGLKDTAADNIIKIMFNAPKNWKWTMDCWEAAGTKAWTNPLKIVLPQGPGRSMRDGFRMCLQEIKLIGDRLEAVEKKVGISKKRLHLMIFNSLLQLSINVGTKPGLVMKPLPKSQDVVSLGKSESVNGVKPGQKDAQEQSGSTTSSSSKELSLVITNVNDPKMTEAKVTEPTVDPSSERERKLAASQQSPFQGSSIAKVIIPNTKIVHGYDPFTPVDKKRTNVLVDWLKLDICYKTTVAKKPPACPSLWYYILRSLLAWLTDSVWRAKYREFKSSEPDRNGLGRRLSGGSWDLYAAFLNNKHIKPAVLDEARCGDCGVFALKYIECHMLEMSFPAAF